MKNKDLISRRKFFKKATGAIIPMIALTTIPSLITSCEIDEPYLDVDATSCKDSCTGSCKNNCKGNCKGGCSNTCYRSCQGSCMSAAKLIYG